MGKTSRKTKAKKADFNKVKLKAGKKRPPPNNVTKTDFKAQSVFVTTQFRNVQSEGSSNKPTKADLKECLSRLGHPAATRRYQSLKNIKDIIVNTPDARFIPRIEILEKVNRKISDVDSEVRKACLEVMTVLFKVFPSNEMKHHFTFMLRLLKCAMLDLNKPVQLDSLKALDLILDHYSDLMDTTYSFQMLTIFLDMISMKTPDNRRVLMATGSGKLGTDKTTSLAWYLNVFRRIHRLLLASNPRKQRNWDNPKHERVFHCWNSWHDMPWTIRPGNPYHQSTRLQAYKPNHKKEATFEDLQAMSGEIYSLLIQCWREVTLSDDCYIGEYTSSIMNVSLQITVQLVEYLLRSTGRRYAMKFVYEVFVDSFNKHFFANFPFEIDDTDEFGVRKRKRRRRNDNNKNKGNNNNGMVVGGARRNLMLLNIAVCKLYTIVYEKKDVEMLKEMSKFLTRFLSRSSITHLLQKNDHNDVDLLRQSLDICDELVKIGNPDVSQPIASVMVKMYERNNRSEKGLPFIHFLSKNYDMDYILPTGENEFSRYFSTILDQLLHYMGLMCTNKVDGKCAIADDNLTNDVTYQHFDLIFCLIKHAHVKREVCYIQQVEGKIIQLLQLMKDGNLFCHHHSKCYDCLRCQMDVITCLLPHVKVLTPSLVKILANYSIFPSSNKQLMHFITDELEKFIENYEDRNDDENTIEENKLQVAQYYRIILFGGTADVKLDVMNDVGLARVADNCDYILETWKRLPYTIPSFFLLQQTLHFYYTNFFQYSISASPRSWAGFLRCFIFIQKQPYAKEFECFHGDVGNFLATIMKCSIEGKYESILISAYQVFNSHEDIRETCLTQLINHHNDSDEGLYALLELAKRPDFGASLSAMSAYIVGKLRKLMPSNTEEATARSRTTETIIALLDNTSQIY